MVSDPVIDAFYPKAKSATSDEELKQITRDMNERVARQHFAISLLKPMEYSLYQPWLKGYTANPFDMDGRWRAQQVKLLWGSVLDRPQLEEKLRVLGC